MGSSGHLSNEESRPGHRAGELDTQPEDGAESIHIPVLFQAVLDGLQVRPGGRYIDATVGGGGTRPGYWRPRPPTGVSWAWIETWRRWR